MKTVQKWLFRAVQWTWGLPQTLLGLLVLLAHWDCRREEHRGAVAVRWGRPTGLSLGMFLFLPPSEDRWYLLHEYGHSLQSLLLGPLYLPLVALPSVFWCRFPPLRRLWTSGRVAYDAVYPENWATAWGKAKKERL